MSCNYNYNNRGNSCYNSSCNRYNVPCFNSCCNTNCDNSNNSPCCTGLTLDKFNHNATETVFAYIDRIFDGKVGAGSALLEDITTNTTDYTTSIQYSSYNNCCSSSTNCNVTTASTFTVENVVSEILDLSLTVTIPKSSVMINGTSIPNDVINNGDGTYTASIATTTTLPNEICRNPQGETCFGNKSTVMLNAISGWKYVARHTISGKVVSGGQACNYCATITNTSSGHSIPTTTTSTFIIQDICIPSNQSSITLSFKANMTLLTPILTAVLSDPTNPTSGIIPKVEAKAIITPEVVGEIIDKTRVCLQVIL